MSSPVVNSSQERSQSSQTEEWIESFIASRADGTSAHTIAFYRAMLKGIKYYSLTPGGIGNFLSELTCGNGKKNYYVAVRAFCNWLYKNGHLSSNPISLVPAPKTRRKLLPAPTGEDVDRIIEQAGEPRDKCLVALAFSSGLRLSELAGIEVPDIDFDDMTTRVVIKGNREARAVFDSRTRALLSEYIGSRATGSLFNLKPRGIQDTMARISRETGIRFSCHSFRRAFASDLRRKGLDISHIMLLGNWQDLSMPLRYSQSVSFEDSLKLYRKLR